MPARKRQLIGAFVLVISAFAVWFGLSAGLMDFRVGRWPTVEATVISKEVVRSDRSAGAGPAARFELRVRYRYSVGGREQTSEAVHPVLRLYTREDADRALEALGESPRAYYDPAQPDRSFLLPGSPVLPFTMAFFGMLAGLVGVGMLLPSRPRAHSSADPA